ncbi:MAG: hypothetical protein ACE5H3_08800 [Planctomycetota bacterium]
MKHLLLLPALIFPVLAAGPVLEAQTATPQNPSSHFRGVPIEVKDLKMHFFTPSYYDTQGLVRTIQPMYGRYLRVTDEGTWNGILVKNISAFEDAILIYDTDEYAQKVIDALKQMESLHEGEEEEVGEESVPMDLKTFQYQPRYISYITLRDALDPFAREVYMEDSEGEVSFDNVSTVDSRSMLLIRETPNRLREIQDLIKKLDVPRPQVMLTCFVIEGHKDSTESPELPSDLVANLRRLLPYSGYERVALGMLHIAAGGGRDQRATLAMNPKEGGEAFQLNLIPGGFDAEQGNLTLIQCEFSTRNGKGYRQVFSTSATVSLGEYSVLAVTGSTPRFVVLKVVSLSGGATQ